MELVPTCHSHMIIGAIESIQKQIEANAKHIVDEKTKHLSEGLFTLYDKPKAKTDYPPNVWKRINALWRLLARHTRQLYDLGMIGIQPNKQGYIATLVFDAAGAAHSENGMTVCLI